MIDAVVMADVKQQCLRRDGGFDLGKVLSECARSLARGDIGKGRQQSPKKRSARWLLFPPPFSSTRRLLSRWLRACSHSSNPPQRMRHNNMRGTHAQRANAPIQRYKGATLREREYTF